MNYDRARKAAVRALLAALVGLPGLTACDGRRAADTAPPTAGDLLLTVDGLPLTRQMVDRYLGSRGTASANAAERLAAEQQLSRVLAVAADVERHDRADPELDAELALARAQVMYNFRVRQVHRLNQPDAAQIEEMYRAMSERSGGIQVRLKSIAYSDEKAALGDLLAIEEGATFEAIENAARTAGREIETLPWADLSQFPPDYATLLKNATAGQVVPLPFADGRAWRIFQVLDSRPFSPPPFDQVRAGIEQDLLRRAVEAHVASLLAEARIEKPEGMEPATE